MNFVSNRDFVLATKHGHAIKFVKGQPVPVPKVCWQDAMTAGCVPEDELPNEEKVAGTPPDDPIKLENAIVDALKVLVGRNKSEDFTGAGYPRVASVAQLTGWPVDKKQLATIWETVRVDLTQG